MSEDKEDLEKEDLFPVQFRHEQVVKFVRGLVEGSIVIVDPPSSSPHFEGAIKRNAQILSAITTYVSGKVRGEELLNIELDLFQKYVLLKVGGVLEDKVTQTQLEREIKDLHLRLDSMSTLLLDLVTILKGLAKE